MGGCCSKRSVLPVQDAELGVRHQQLDRLSLLKHSCMGHRATLSDTDAQSVLAVTPSSVKVAVVVRPLMPFEQQKGGGSSVAVQPPDKVVLSPLSQKTVAGGGDGAAEFVYDRVYHGVNAAAGQQMFRDMVQPVVERVCQGFNGCILAYGQTGSGKTYQMGGVSSQLADSSSSNNSAAVLPQACGQLLKYMSDAKDVYDVQLKVSYVEIYNEVIQDLLAQALPPASGTAGGAAATRGASSPGPRHLAASLDLNAGSAGGATVPGNVRALADMDVSISAGSGSSGGGGGSGSVSIYENAAGQIVLDGVTEVVVGSAADLSALLQRGSTVRATASHKLNSQSSRSHAILTLTLQQRAHVSKARQLPREVQSLCSKLHLVDLAGSERAKETGTTGQRFAEGVSINKGLLELGNVINALTEGASRKHIPYRNSKLTRLLQDSLGGNSETLFIACISPADTNRDHTLGTLRYASRAMSIKNNLQRSVMSPAEELAYFKELVVQLEEENVMLKQVITSAGLQVAKGQRRMDQICEVYVKAG